MAEKKKAQSRGRPTKYTVELANKICELVSVGVSLRAISELKDMPDKATIIRWLGSNSDFCDQYARAREEQADFFADEIIEIADAVEEDSNAIAKAKLQIEARKWRAAKLSPKKYGDKFGIDHTTNGKDIQPTIIELVAAGYESTD